MTRDTCNVRQPNGVWRCDLAPGHRGDHRSDVHLDGCPTWPNHRDKPKPEPSRHKQGSGRRGKRLNPVSEKQSVRQAFIAGVKAERIANAIRAEGQAECSNCPKAYQGHSAAHQNLQLHHEVKRSRGHGYQPGKGAGVDEPGNLTMLCHQCHREAEASEPMFGASA